MLDTPKLQNPVKEADLFLPMGSTEICETRTKARAGFPQIFIMDPDRNVIELNARLSGEDVQRVNDELKKAKKA